MLNKALRLMRVFHDLSQAEMASKLGISKSYLSEIEAGKKEPTLQLLRRYSELLDVPLSSIFFFSERANEEAPSEKVRLSLSRKVVSILEFIAERARRNEKE